MKKIIPFLFSILLSKLVLGQIANHKNQLLPQIDQRVELLGIVYHLAKNGEVPDSPNPRYAKAINDHFKPYLGHPLVGHLKQQIDRYAKDSLDIGDWEVPSLAVHLGQPPKFELLVGKDAAVPDGWDDRSLLDEKTAYLLRDFYKKAKCARFFKRQKPYYSAVLGRYEKEAAPMNDTWLQRFFGLEPTEQYYPILGLSKNFGWAYIRTNFEGDRRNTHTIFGTNDFDGEGIPTDFAKPGYAAMLLHERIHCFANQLVDKNQVALRPYAEVILADPEVNGLVKNTFYGNWQYLLYESMVRSISIRYKMGNGAPPDEVEKDLVAQEKAGFLWMRDLVKTWDLYEKDRAKFKTAQDYMPAMADFFKNTAAKYGSDKK